jgi:hypothetical protein
VLAIGREERSSNLGKDKMPLCCHISSVGWFLNGRSRGLELEGAAQLRGHMS